MRREIRGSRRGSGQGGAERRTAPGRAGTAGGTTPAHVAGCYQGLIDALVVDGADGPAELPGDVRCVVTETLMKDAGASRRLAAAVLDAAGTPA